MQDQNLTNFILSNIQKILGKFTFEQISPLTKHKIKIDVSNFLEECKYSRSIRDFEVICDETNNSTITVDESKIVVTFLFVDADDRTSPIYTATISSAPKPLNRISAAVDIDIDVSVGTASSSSSKPSTHGGYPTYGTIPAPQSGIGNIGGQSIGGGQYQIGSQGNVQPTIGVGSSVINGIVGTINSGTLGSTSTANTGASSILPDIVFSSFDDAGNSVKLFLEPESTISAIDTIKILMMMISYSANRNSFSPFQYVKKNHLERHFKFKV